MVVFVGGMRFKWSRWSSFCCFFRWNEVLRVQVEFVVPFSARGGCFLQVSRGL